MSTLKKLPSKRILGKLTQVCIFLIIAFFWRSYLLDNWAKLRTVDIEIQWGLVPLSCALCICGFLLLGFLWHPFLSEMSGISLGFLRAFRISALTWIWRYVPGKIWTVVSKTYMSTNHERSKTAAVAILVSIETIWSQMTGLLIAVAIAPFYSRHLLGSTTLQVTSLVCAVASFVVIHPAIFLPTVNTALRLMRQPLIDAKIRYGHMLFLMTGYMGVFLLWSLSFVVLLHSVDTVSWRQVPLVAAIFCGAWTIGTFSLFAPGGLGVRESLIAIGLGEVMHYEPGVVLAIVVSSRLLTTTSELFCYILAMLIPDKTPPNTIP